MYRTQAYWIVLVCVVTGVVVPAMAQNATAPGAISAYPTWTCVGINWHYRGDGNANGSVEVAFRRVGTAEWRPAMPLFRHRFEDRVMFSGSVFRLAPGTAYEFKLRLHDPDGGEAERVVTATTRAYPRLPSRVVRVDKGGLAEAQRLAQPGTVMVLAPGTYRGTVLTTSGRPGEPIVYSAAKEGDVVIEGVVEIRANHVWLDNLTLRNDDRAVLGFGDHVRITRCRLSAHYAIHTPEGVEGWFIADNVMQGDSGGRFSFDGEGVDLGSDAGRGHAVCFNELSEFADGVSYGGANIDVYNNFIHECVDDFIEPDYSRENYRVWNNRCYNAMCGFSFQPMKGGPWYFFDNINVGTYLHALKIKKITGPVVLYGNTMLTKTGGGGGLRTFLQGLVLNNIWARTTPGPLTASGQWPDDLSTTRFDYNAYGTDSPEPFAAIDYAKTAAAHSWDAHSLKISPSQIFAEPVRNPTGRPYYSSDLPGTRLPADWRFDHALLLPRPGSPIIDAGTVVANLTGPYLGKAPDLGAHELGLGTAWYGPRTWDAKTGLIYGIPDGWHQVPVASAGQYADLGCPRAPDASVLLVRDSPRAFAMMRLEPAEGESRWRQLDRLAADTAGAMTPALTFQDGLVARLIADAKTAHLLAARIEPTGVLHVTAGCAVRDLDDCRLGLFQFVRSLCR